jgi:uncharacterized membrane protein YphA (DoxX/SURF4 family)
MKDKNLLFVLLRIYLGVILLVTVYGKITSSSPFVNEMNDFIQGEIAAKRPEPFYAQFLHDTVEPHAQLFSNLIMIAEFAAGLGLLFGIFTPVSAFIALFLFLNYMLAKGRSFWSPDSEDAAVFFIALVVLVSKAGRLIGVDFFLARRYPHSFFW